MASFTAAGTSYAHRGVPMVPFFIFYSMFGFQRVGDLIWAGGRRPGQGLPARRHRRAHHAAGRGPAAPGRPQPGAGLDRAHLPGLRPGLRLRDGRHRREPASRRMYGARRAGDESDVFYYLTLYNENYLMPARPDGVHRRGHPRGPLPVGAAARRASSRAATILFSGSAQGAAREAQAALAEHYGVGAELWSATSYKRLREDALSVERWNRLHPGQPARTRRRSPASWPTSPGPIVAVTDFMKAVPDQIARFVPGRPRLRAARHRRLRPLRHPRGAAPVLRDRRRPRRGRRAGRAGRRRASVEPSAVADAIERHGVDPDTRRPPHPLTPLRSRGRHGSSRPRPCPITGDPDGRPAADDRSAGPADRHAARPAGADGVGLQGPGHAQGPPGRSARRRRHRGHGPRGPVVAVFWPSRRCTATRRPWPGGPTTCASSWSTTTTATPARCGAACDGDELYRRLRELPGYGDEKAKIFVAILAKRLGKRPTGWEEAAAPFSDARPRGRWPTSTRPSRWPRSASSRRPMKAAGQGQGRELERISARWRPGCAGGRASPAAPPPPGGRGAAGGRRRR